MTSYFFVYSNQNTMSSDTDDTMSDTSSEYYRSDKEPGSRLRHAMVCQNNYTHDQYLLMQLFCSQYCSYAVIGKEVGEQNGTPHLQAYLELKKQMRFNTVRKHLPACHLEDRRLSPKQCATYCKKEGNFWEMGTISNQGKRTDLERFSNHVASGVSDRELVENDFAPYIMRYFRGMNYLRNVTVSARGSDTPKEVLWLYGPSGSGKTRWAYSTYPNLHLHGPESGKWWDTYSQEETILLDEVDGTMPYRYLLRLTDRYPFLGETKGGFVHITSDRIIITCSRHYKDVYFEESDHSELARRITRVYKFPDDLPENFSGSRAENSPEKS